MRLKHKILIALFILVFTNSFYLALAESPRYFDETKIYNYLKSQQNEKTGLVNSFVNTKDTMLLNQASTYDQALAGIAFLVLGDCNRAERILRFFDNKWSADGFANFYNTKTGNVGIECTIHLGPNAWIALLALQYTAITGNRKYLDLAKKIAFWAVKLNHKKGGLAMGPVKDWATDWSEVYSSENNIDAYTVFDLLHNYISSDEDKKLFESEKEGIKNFLRIITFSQNPRIRVGIDNPAMATDVIAISMLAFEPAQLKFQMKISPEEFFEIAEKQFLVSIDGIQGYEFADKESVREIGRPNMISLEWTAMMALAYFKLADYCKQFYELTGDNEYKINSDKYQDKSIRLIGNLDKKILTISKDAIAYPYATKGLKQVFPFSPWWKTPSDGKDGRLAASLASSCWRVFVEKKFNPFELKSIEESN